MSRGLGKLQRWLLEEGLSEEPRTLTDIAHRWYLSTIGRECTDLHVCCDNPEFAPSRSERESVRRAIKRLEEDESRFVRGGRAFVVRWSTAYRLGPLYVEGELAAWLHRADDDDHDTAAGDPLAADIPDPELREWYRAYLAERKRARGDAEQAADDEDDEDDELAALLREPELAAALRDLHRLPAEEGEA